MTRQFSSISTISLPVAFGIVFLSGFLALTAYAPTTALARGRAADAPDNVQFLPPINYFSGGTNPQSVAIADLNGDGFPDAIVANTESTSVTIFSNHGDGVFARGATYNLGGVLGVVAADLNGDHKVDLVVGGGDNVAVLLGNGDGTFQPPATFDTGNDSGAVAVGDVNRDGIPDIVTASFFNGTVSILLGNGDGTFQAPLIYATNADSLLAIAIADFNGDGKPDLAISCYPPPFGGGIMLGNGDGSFQPPIGEISGQALAVGDLNGDGKMDVVSGLTVLLGNGDGTLTEVTGPGFSGSPSQVALADVNHDGKLDVLFAYYEGGDAGVMLGNGDGTLQSPTLFSSKRYGSGAIAVADVDGNGKPDVLLTDLDINRLRNFKGGWLTVLRNNSGSPSNTAVATSGSPSHVHQPVTFTATVNANGVPAPDGDLVRFYRKGTLLASVPLKGGTAIFTTTLSKGTYEIKATYIGDFTLQYSSATVEQVVEKP